MFTTLPHGLMGVRDDYKRCTKIVIRWLKENGSSDQIQHGHSTLRDLLQLAQTVEKRKIKLPDEIAFSFRQTISLRSQMSAWYDQTFSEMNDYDVEMSTARHERFTSTLQVIYDHLSTLGIDKDKNTSHSVSTLPKDYKLSEMETSSTLNRFAALYLEYQEATPSPKPSFPNEPATPASVADHHHSEDEDEDTTDGLEDDMLESFLDSYLSLINLDALTFLCKMLWSRVARNETPFAVAAAVSRFIFCSSNQNLRILAAGPWAQDTDAIFKLVHQCRTTKQSDSDETNRSEAKPATYIRDSGLLGPLRIMDSFEFSHQDSSEHNFCDPRSLISPRAEVQSDAICFRNMLSSALCYDTTLGFELDDDVYLKAIQRWREHPKDGLSRVTCAASLRLVLESQRGYLWPCEDLDDEVDTPKWYTKISTNLNPATNPRIIYLRFMQEIVDKMKRIETHPGLDKCCRNSLGSKCSAYRSTVEGLLKAKNFEIYFQSPLIAGDNILRIRQNLYQLGLRLVNHKHHVASILHAYNALRCSGKVQAIPILDDLCAIFEESVFLGSLPVSNFSSRYLRYRGAKLHFGHDESDIYKFPSSFKMWQMDIKDHEREENSEHVENNHFRFNPFTFDMSLFSLTTRSKIFANHQPYWARVFGFKNWSSLSKEDSQRLASILSSCTMTNHPIRHLEASLVSEFAGNNEASESARYQNDVAAQMPLDATDPLADLERLSNGHIIWHNAELPACPEVWLFEGRRQRCACGKFCNESWETCFKQRSDSSIPYARINYGSVWQSCAEAVARVNGELLKNHDRADCKCGVRALLEFIDMEHKMNRASKKTKKRIEEVIEKHRRAKAKPRTAAQELMTDPVEEWFEGLPPELFEVWTREIEVFRDKEVKDFLWENLI